MAHSWKFDPDAEDTKKSHNKRTPKKRAYCDDDEVSIAEVEANHLYNSTKSKQPETKQKYK